MVLDAAPPRRCAGSAGARLLHRVGRRRDVVAHDPQHVVHPEAVLGRARDLCDRAPPNSACRQPHNPLTGCRFAPRGSRKEGGEHGSRGVQQRQAAEQRTGAGGDRVAHVEADHLLDLAEHALGVRAREVDLVEDLRRAHAAREHAARVRK